jgi:calcium permeable stress-gated cation channel
MLFNSTPRSVFQTKFSPRMEQWGSLFPKTTQLVVITFGYSIISPIINGLAFAAFFLFYMLYKYLFTWVNDQPSSSETGGLFFPKAMDHIFVGLYVEQLCLCALFFLAQNDKHHPSAVAEGALTVVLIIFTVSIGQRLVFNDSHARARHSSMIPYAVLTALSSRPYLSLSLIVPTIGTIQKILRLLTHQSYII